MIKMVIFCVIAFALTWLPFNALIVIGDMRPDIWERQDIMYIWFITHYLAMCHTITNPLIYIWMNNRFRAGFKQVIRDIWRPIKMLLLFLWCNLCCLGCTCDGATRKYSRVSSNSKAAATSNASGALGTGTGGGTEEGTGEKAGGDTGGVTETSRLKQNREPPLNCSRTMLIRQQSVQGNSLGHCVTSGVPISNVAILHSSTGETCHADCSKQPNSSHSSAATERALESLAGREALAQAVNTAPTSGAPTVIGARSAFMMRLDETAASCVKAAPITSNGSLVEQQEAVAARRLTKYIRAVRRLRDRRKQGEQQQQQLSEKRGPKKKPSHAISIQMTSTEYHKQAKQVAAANTSSLRCELVEHKKTSHKERSSGDQAAKLGQRSLASNERAHHKQPNQTEQEKKAKTSTRKLRAGSESFCTNCRLEATASVDAPESGKPEPLIVDTRQSSVSTATISMQTNTTSLAVSPMNSLRDIADCVGQKKSRQLRRDAPESMSNICKYTSSMLGPGESGPR